MSMWLAIVFSALLALCMGLQQPRIASKVLSRRVNSPRTPLQLKVSLGDLVGTEQEESETTDETALAPLKLIIAGAPAAGKGTQCENIVEKFDVVHLSTGDMLRAAVKEGSELGAKAKEFMDNGQLVPDELITNVVCERLQQTDCENKGWLLDGFPRTLSQAEALENAGMSPDCFVLLNVPQEVLVERVTGRRTDPETGKIYHMTFSPPTDPEVTSRLVQRSDDTEEKIVVRYQEFLKHVGSVKGCYDGVCVEVDGANTPAEVNQQISSALEEAQQKKNEIALAEIKEKKKRNTEATNLVLGLYGLYTADRLLATTLAKIGVSFPAPLIGMVGLFTSMCAIDRVNPQKAEDFNYFLTPASAFLKLWLTLLLVPPVVVAPLKMALFKENGFKYLAMIAGGFVLNLPLAALIAEKGRQVFAPAKVETDEICAEVECTTGPSETVGVVKNDAPRLPSLPAFTGPAKATLISLVLCALSTALAMDGAADISRRIFGTALTVASYTFAVQQTPAQLKLFLHPVIVSATLIYSGYCALARTTGETARVALMSYFGSGTGPGDILSRLLGTAIISFGVQLFQYKDLLFRNKMRFFLSTFATAVTGVLSSAVGVRYLQVTGLTSQASILTRCITTPLAIAAGKLTGADPTLTSAVSLLTGIIGASTGPRLLSKMRVEDPLSQGMALGSSSHSLGASAVVDNPVKFAGAIVAMCLTGVWTVALLSVPVVRELVLKLASN